MAFYKRLRPLRDKLKYSEDLEKILAQELFNLIYKPLIDLLSVQKQNAKPSPLIQAFLSRTIHFSEGYVYGKFNAAISRALRGFGATFNDTKKAFKIDLAQLPPDVRDALARGSMAEQQAIDRMRAKAEELASQAISIPALHALSEDTLADLHKQFEKLTPEDLQIPVEMNEQMEEKVRRDYTEAVHLNINNLSQEMTERLRYRVEQAVGQGMRADKLKEVLIAEFGIAKNRAAFIARQDTSLFVAKYREVRYKDAGINLYQWSTSNDPRVRHDHRELNGRIFSFDAPPITDHLTGARNNPGEDFNCLPEDSNIDLAYGIRKCFRRWYSGKLATVVTESGKTLRATPNHQVLTSCGWKAIGLLDETDYVVNLSEQLTGPKSHCINNSVTLIGQIFSSLVEDFPVLARESNREDFHGDGVDGNVDVVYAAGGLMVGLKAETNKRLQNLLLALADALAFCKGLLDSLFYFLSLRHLFSCQMGVGGESLSFGKGGFLESLKICFRGSSNFNASVNKFPMDGSTGNPGAPTDGRFPLSRKIGFNYWFRIKNFPLPRFSAFPSVGLDAPLPEAFNECIRTKADDLGGFFARQTGIEKLDRVVKTTIGDFSGHVFNLETLSNWFIGDGILYHNCRCVALPVVLQSGKSSRPLVEHEIEGENVLETSEHKRIYA